ncbi:MAG TPA: hypothetical protein VMV28_07785 [Thermoplasmata archaeon]|nr:hypothetical protein [Thermoplasmata archaeon]
MLEPSDFEVNILEFRHKSFSYDRLATVGGIEFVVFTRTETESESRLRPHLIHLRVIVPRASVVLDIGADLLFLAPDGVRPGPREAGTAVESAAEGTEFREQGFDFRRVALAPDSFVYVAREEFDRVLSDDGRRVLGLA